MSCFCFRARRSAAAFRFFRFCTWLGGIAAEGQTRGVAPDALRGRGGAGDISARSGYSASDGDASMLFHQLIGRRSLSPTMPNNAANLLDQQFLKLIPLSH